MTITPSRQRNAVSEGMALGLIMCGRNTIRLDKVMVDLAFEGAWRSWPYADRFSQVHTDLRNGSGGARVMSRADERKQVWNLFWDTSGGELAIYSRPQWDDEDIDAEFVAGMIDGGVPAEGWRALAQGFLDRFER